MTITLRHRDPVATALAGAIRDGDLDALARLLAAQPGLASVRIQDERGTVRTPLHIAADWPGYFPNGAAVVAALIAAGGDPNAPVEGCAHAETPLHWAASSDDLEVAEALIAGGADIEAPGASIAGGTPLDDAVGYGCWAVARLLVARGARVDKLWHAAALGMLPRIVAFFDGPNPPAPSELNDAFWQACHGGQRRAAAYLLDRGADVNWTPDHTARTPLDIAAALTTERESLVGFLRERGARSAGE